MEQIFDLQWKLNTYTLKNIGIDYHTSIVEPDQKTVWIENYRKALSAELAELIREVKESGIGSENGKIEIVDMLHFLVSLSHIVGLQASELPEPSDWSGEAAENESATENRASFDQTVIDTFLHLDDLQNSVKWKWWARGGGFNAEKAKSAVEALWIDFYGMCSLFAMDQATVERIYVGKNEINFRRQDGSYNEDAKTEEDNEALVAAISAGRT